MKIREATNNDIPNIVEVLKASLGEAEIALTQEVWNFKHILNPFGESIVLIALEDEKIIGVRAFMRWQWTLGDKTLNTFRAVDTATHPDHQGKGIFKKLTLEAVEIAKSNANHFIFNTPNDQSRPGYLKMGWETVDNIVVSLQPSYTSFWKLRSKKDTYTITKQGNDDELKLLCDKWNDKWRNQQKLFTVKSPEYLKWRYETNPLQKYEVMSTEDFYVAGYIKKRKNLKELRISECICLDSTAVRNKLQKQISLWASKFSVQVISYSPGVTSLKYPSKTGSYGPVLTIKNLNVENSDWVDYKKINSWKYSLGDLELF